MTSKRIPILALAAIAAFVLAGCSGSTSDNGGDSNDGATDTSGSTGGAGGADPGCPSGGSKTKLVQAGSSTVLPIAEAWAEEFARCINADITVGGGGTGAGFQKFCRGELDISDASRPIRPAAAPGAAPSETDTCKAAGIEPFEVQIAIDGLSIVVADDNTFVQCLTVAQLNKIWTADKSKQVSKWRQLDPSWPDETIELFGPGTDSGTYDYFREVIVRAIDGSTAEPRSDFTPSEDDNVLVQGVASSEHAMGYFGLAYFEENQDKLNIVKVDDGKGNGCVEPTPANVESGKYAPLSRPLFMYTDGKPSGTMQAYFQQGLSQDGQDIVEEVGYIGLPAPKLAEMRAKIA
ncbi:MAG: phosphate transport system substrate-binding protein [Thermoplasmata archaeon]|jgi:phosphate transport system substrate-binding protein|nr:phosphate transport system substrate-binding protein [Thermoplasmata archaeon]MEA3166060.1 phosphate transport system substrate-binding protein [Thermoplasmata archaeon]